MTHDVRLDVKGIATYEQFVADRRAKRTWIKKHTTQPVREFTFGQMTGQYDGQGKWNDKVDNAFHGEVNWTPKRVWGMVAEMTNSKEAQVYEFQRDRDAALFKMTFQGF